MMGFASRQSATSRKLPCLPSNQLRKPFLAEGIAVLGLRSLEIRAFFKGTSFRLHDNQNVS